MAKETLQEDTMEALGKRIAMAVRAGCKAGKPYDKFLGQRHVYCCEITYPSVREKKRKR